MGVQHATNQEDGVQHATNQEDGLQHATNQEDGLQHATNQMEECSTQPIGRGNAAPSQSERGAQARLSVKIFR